ncbi:MULTISPECIES: DUF4112 domain-containing protein [Planktothricoides]|uniref:DUF4112 domain-containing protein n=2 Tax=Planktothricoides raciborskii TaxID=132608 RepID=A0AAU8JAQ4_9CYAN|nr:MULTISPECIES: DUF4112 domain-containing protein [Planktothricoides]KOR37926.1 hypothetical protein AM228_03795 [Planktothricoides sp. SR001]MBD2542768.1 DUF4112 domain-containing protein [Planktothricoides raciborskii FACHB-1370]MBD2581485.1 DUF4112 domain-containing protein [Planktothricoides raciborskii FACHB-1261]
MTKPKDQQSNQDSNAKIIQRLRTLTHVLDNAIPIPGTNYRIGLDPFLGLIPGGGDIAGAALSAYIVISAAQLGLPRESLLRMVFNILLEVFVGTVPVLGDLFDVAWKANVKNMELLDIHIKSPQMGKKADKWFVFLLVGGLMLVVIGAIALGITLITLVFGLLTGNG